jgi:Flp pilus assembly protein TadG
MLADAHPPAGILRTMLSFLKKLWHDRRGNALIIAGAALPLIVGSAGLAVDTVQWSLWKRQLQRMADSGALAGAYAKAEGTTLDSCANYSTATYAQPIGYDVKKNNRVWPTLTCAATNPPSTGSYTTDSKAVRVTVSVQQSLPFSGFFMAAAPTLTASATAKMIQTGKYCLVALNNTSTSGITMGGSSSANLGCGAISNSTSTSSAVTPTGGAYSFSADPVASVGGMPSSIIGSTNLQPFSQAMPDPFAGLYPTDIPSGMTCDSFNNKKFQTNANGQVVQGNPPNSQTHLPAGCYTDFAPSGNGTYYLDPGTFYLNNTSFNPGGSTTLIGTGVTIILTGTTPGSVDLSGNQTIKLTAPVGGTYDKMLFIQSSAASLNNLNKFNGTSSSFFDGAFYFPKALVQFNGTTAASTSCAMVVAWTVDISGNANFQNSLTKPDGSPCDANKNVPGYVMKLVE